MIASTGARRAPRQWRAARSVVSRGSASRKGAPSVPRWSLAACLADEGPTCTHTKALEGPVPYRGFPRPLRSLGSTWRRPPRRSGTTGRASIRSLCQARSPDLKLAVSRTGAGPRRDGCSHRIGSRESASRLAARLSSLGHVGAFHAARRSQSPPSPAGPRRTSPLPAGSRRSFAARA